MADWEKALSLWRKPSDRSARREARTRIVNLLPRWDAGNHKDAYRQRWEDGFAKQPADLDSGYWPSRPPAPASEPGNFETIVGVGTAAGYLSI